MIKIFADGSSLGNPGNSGIGVVVYKNNKILKKSSFYIGKVTNNFAEYIALLVALHEAVAIGDKPVFIYMDSELVTKQVEGAYKVKESSLYPLNVVAKNLIHLIGECSVVHESRENNKLADSLARDAAQSGFMKKPGAGANQLTLGI